MLSTTGAGAAPQGSAEDLSTTAAGRMIHGALAADPTWQSAVDESNMRRRTSGKDADAWTAAAASEVVELQANMRGRKRPAPASGSGRPVKVGTGAAKSAGDVNDVAGSVPAAAADGGGGSAAKQPVLVRQVPAKKVDPRCAACGDGLARALG